MSRVHFADEGAGQRIDIGLQRGQIVVSSVDGSLHRAAGDIRGRSAGNRPDQELSTSRVVRLQRVEHFGAGDERDAVDGNVHAAVGVGGGVDLDELGQLFHPLLA